MKIRIRETITQWLQGGPSGYEASLMEEVQYECAGPFGTTQSGTGIVEKIETRPPPPEEAKIYHVRTDKGVLYLFSADLKPKKDS